MAMASPREVCFGDAFWGLVCCVGRWSFAFFGREGGGVLVGIRLVANPKAFKSRSPKE